MRPYLSRINEIRRAHPALQQLRELHFHHVDNDNLLAYSKTDPVSGDTVLCVVTLDPGEAQAGTVWLDMPALGLAWDAGVEVHDEVSEETYHWGQANYVRLEPWRHVAHILRLAR